MRDRPVAWRLLGVSALAIAMGLVFGGLRVASAADSAASFGRVSTLANLGQQVTVLVQSLENERDETTGIAPVVTKQQIASLQTAYQTTDTAAASVATAAAGVNGSFPVNIQAKVASVLSAASGLKGLRAIAEASQSPLSVIAAYATPIANMISLNAQIAQGTSDATLANDVQTLNALSLAKDEASQQRALMYNSLKNSNFADGELQALETAQSVQATDQTAFNTSATPTERNAFFSDVGGPLGPLINQAQSVETYILDNGAVDPATLTQGGFNPLAIPQVSFTDMSATIRGMQTVEQVVSGNIVARAQTLQQGAVSSAVITSILTVVILLIVALATLLVARSLVLPLRRLQADALNIATVQLPERVRRLGESADAAASLEVAPIDVTSGDEIGRVARAFDQVHAEAVRLAGNEALLRNRYNAMFVNLSRRSQSLIERLVRMIDSLEQNEDDPSRLSNLFAMDHLVTRMRRNSENLLLLAGHEAAKKWSEPVPLTDVARAAISEIEHYNRVALNIQQGVSVAGSAVSDVVHLLAEVIENATTFSPRDTQVQMTAQEVSSGGVLIEVVDNGVGIPDQNLAEINERLDNPPVMDVSVSRHMGLFAVGRLAERHGIRVRLRPRAPQGIIAMVWLPDAILQDGDRALGRRHPALRQMGTQGRRATAGATSRSPLAAQAAQPEVLAPPAPREVPSALPPREVPPVPQREPMRPKGGGRSVGTATSKWFSDPRGQEGGPMGTGPMGTGPMGTGPMGTGPMGTGPMGTGPMAGGPMAASGRGGANGGTGFNGGSGYSGSNGGTGSASGATGAGGLPQRAPAGQSHSGQLHSGMNFSEAAQIVNDPVRGDTTSSGLPLRVPRANLLPGSIEGARQSEHAMSGHQADQREAQPPVQPRSQRTPEIARNRMSGFQRGVRRGHQHPAPRAGEGIDR